MNFFNIKRSIFPKKLPSYKLQARPGFTLVELLLVIAIMAVVGGMSLPMLQSFQVSSDLNTYSTTVVRTLRRAQLQAIAGQNSNSWGVFFDTTNKTMTLFYGSNYSTRDQNYDQLEAFPPSYTVSTDFSDQIYFSTFSGAASASGTVSLSNQNNQTTIIAINSIGVIQEQ